MKWLQHSLDAQYFLWEADHVGYLMISRVLHAADRGVRIRLLVDDLSQAASTTSIAALNLQPNIEIRVFNPLGTRRPGVFHSLEFAMGFRTLNQRMHNKLLVADNAAAIVGGRNIGDAYFGLDETSNFVDFDAVIVGPVVGELSDVFDTYWNGPAAHPASALDLTVNTGDLDATRALIGSELSSRTSALAAFRWSESTGAIGCRRRSIRCLRRRYRWLTTCRVTTCGHQPSRWSSRWLTSPIA